MQPAFVNASSSLKGWAPWVFLLFAAVVTGLVLLGMYMDGTFPKLNQNDADEQCAKCIESSCAPDAASIIDPVKACAAIKDMQVCSCSGTCVRQCKQSNAYMPSQCTETYCNEIN